MAVLFRLGSLYCHCVSVARLRSGGGGGGGGGRGEVGGQPEGIQDHVEKLMVNLKIKLKQQKAI